MSGGGIDTPASTPPALTHHDQKILMPKKPWIIACIAIAAVAALTVTFIGAAVSSGPQYIRSPDGSHDRPREGAKEGENRLAPIASVAVSPGHRQTGENSPSKKRSAYGIAGKLSVGGSGLRNSTPVLALGWTGNAVLNKDALDAILDGEAVNEVFYAQVLPDGSFWIDVGKPGQELSVSVYGSGLYATPVAATSVAPAVASTVEIEVRSLFATVFSIVDASNLEPPTAPLHAFDGQNSYRGHGVSAKPVTRESANPIVEIVLDEFAQSLPHTKQFRVIGAAPGYRPELELRIDLVGYAPYSARYQMWPLTEATEHPERAELLPDTDRWGTVRISTSNFPSVAEEGLPFGDNAVVYLESLDGRPMTMMVCSLGRGGVTMMVPEGRYRPVVASIHDIARRPFPCNSDLIEVISDEAALIEVDFSTTSTIVVLPDSDRGADWSLAVRLTAADGSYKSTSVNGESCILFGITPGTYTLAPEQSNGLKLEPDKLSFGPINLEPSQIEYVTLPMQ